MVASRRDALAPTNPDRVYTIVNAQSLMRSDDRGATFVTVQTIDDIIDSLLVSSRSVGTLYLGFGVLSEPESEQHFQVDRRRSSDGGGTWIDATDPLRRTSSTLP